MLSPFVAIIVLSSLLALEHADSWTASGTCFTAIGNRAPALGETPGISKNLRLAEPKHLNGIPAHPSTEIACFEGYGPIDGLAEWLKRQPRLEELSLICVCLVDEDIDAILRLPRLIHLDLRGSQVTTGQLSRLRSKLTEITLDLRGVTVTP